MESSRQQLTAEEVIDLLKKMKLPYDTVEEIYYLGVRTLQDASCTFLSECLHSTYTCQGKLYRLEGGGYVCEEYLDRCLEVDGEYEHDECDMCGIRPSFKLASKDPVKDIQEYTKLVEQEVPFEKYSTEAVDFFKTYMLPLYFTHQHERFAGFIIDFE